MADYEYDLLRALKPVQKYLGKFDKVLTTPTAGKFFGWAFGISWRLTVFTIRASYYSAKKLAGRY